MKNPTDDDAYDVLFRSYELANKQIKEIQAQLAAAQAEIKELTTLKSELRERTDLLFSYALKAKELEARLAECRKVRNDYPMGVDPIEYNEMCHKTAGMHDRLVEVEAQLATAQEYVAALESMATSHSDKVEVAAAKYYRMLNTQMCVRCQKPGHRCECEPGDFEDMY